MRQLGRDLGLHLARAFLRLVRQHSRVIVIGTDFPSLAPSILRLALRELQTTDAVHGPCPDRGYYLIGLRRMIPDLLKDVRLETEFAFRDTPDSLLAYGFSCSVLEPCGDIDLPQDLVVFKRTLLKAPATRRVMPQTWRFLTEKL
jgi:uncharacterized protein